MNKNYFKQIFAGLGLILIVLSSCKKNNFVVDQDPLNVPSYARFNTRLLADSVATYYIKSTNAPFKLPIGVTTVSNRDRTINFSYTSTSAVAGVQFNAPASITIPAGKTIDTLLFTGMFSGYPLSSRRDTVIITITGDGDIPGSPYITPRKDTYKLILRKYCDVTLSSFLGAYNNCTDRQGTGPLTPFYTSTIVSATPLGTNGTAASIVVYNFGDPMFGDPYNPGDLAITPGITLNLDWADPANFKITVPNQAIAVSYYGPTGLIKPATTGAGTFSSCDNTFTVSYSFSIGATNYGNFTTILKR